MGILRHVVRTPPGLRFHARRRQARKMRPGGSAAATPRAGLAIAAEGDRAGTSLSAGRGTMPI
jgi:hypothetical protein